MSNKELALDLLYSPSSLQSTYFLTGLSCLRTSSGRHVPAKVSFANLEKVLLFRITRYAQLFWRRCSSLSSYHVLNSKGFSQRRWCFISHHPLHISVASCTAVWPFYPLDWGYVVCLVTLCTHNSQHCHNSLQLHQSTHIL